MGEGVNPYPERGVLYENKNFNILIIDDDVNLREVFTEASLNWPYNTAVAKSGAEGLERLKSGRFDIVVCDLMMPGMDGMTFLKRARELDGNILVIIMTAYATIETAVKAIEAGAYDFIAKPFRLDEFMILLKNACVRLSLEAKNRELSEELKKAKDELRALKKP